MCLLEGAGLRPNDVTWVYLANGEAKAALATGSIDAWGSYVGIAVLENGDRILADAHGLPTGAGFFAASDGAIGKKRAQLAALIALLRSSMCLPMQEKRGSARCRTRMGIIHRSQGKLDCPSGNHNSLRRE